MAEKAQIPEFYRNKSVFITGATGFIGKVLIWKLLQSCPLIDKIYILLRPRRNKNVSDRREELLNTLIFDNFKEANPKILDKIIAISGDIGEPNLGLSDNDKARLTDEVDIVFYGAAVLKMDASLKEAINVNTEGLLRMIDIAKEMKRMTKFVYISTAYCSCDEALVEEKLYPFKTSPRGIISAINTLPPKLVDKITNDLISPLPNTYTYSKRLAEILTEEYKTDIPICIARPTIVIPAFQEPIPGWIDTMNGVAGLSIAAGAGVARTTFGNADLKANLVPVDTVCNGLIAIPWAEAQKQNKSDQIPIYNLAATDEDMVTWRVYQKLICKANVEYPFEMCLWYPQNDLFFEANPVLYKIKVLLFHWLPAFIIDSILFILRRKQVMMRIQHKISKGSKVLAYFLSNEWVFQMDNLLSLEKSMNAADADIFPVRITSNEIYPLLTNSIILIKKYILKESPDNLTKCRRRHKMLYILKILVDAALYFIIINLILNFLTRKLNLN